MKKAAILFMTLAFATFAHSPPAVAHTTAKSEKYDPEKATNLVLPSIEISGADLSMNTVEMFYQADSPKSSPALNGNSGMVIISDTQIIGEKPDDAWSVCEMAYNKYNFKAMTAKTRRYRPGTIHNYRSPRLSAPHYSTLGYNKRS